MLEAAWLISTNKLSSDPALQPPSERFRLLQVHWYWGKLKYWGWIKFCCTTHKKIPYFRKNHTMKIGPILLCVQYFSTTNHYRYYLWTISFEVQKIVAKSKSKNIIFPNFKKLWVWDLRNAIKKYIPWNMLQGSLWKGI